MLDGVEVVAIRHLDGGEVIRQPELRVGLASVFVDVLHAELLGEVMRDDRVREA